ncbi:MAG: gephyrin-like molybdotransferase Glp [Nostocoides sp.]
MTLRSVADHRFALLDALRALPARSVPTPQALGMVLAADVAAATDLPGFDNSAMDGYAVRAVDLAGAGESSPVTLPVDGDIAAGDSSDAVLLPGRALRIMTGAVMPSGADAVVPVEFTDGGVTEATFRLQPEPGRHIRRRGEDIRVDDVLLRAGQWLGPGHIGLITSANVARVAVHPRPRVAVYSTGDELAPVGSVLGHGQIVDSNGAMLAALARAAGAEVVAVEHLPDDAGAVATLLAELDSRPDLVVTTGGVSMGAYDTVKEVLSGAGVEFVKVAMRPGMPQGQGRIGPCATPIVALPGNPVSSLVSFHLFVLPMLARLSGAAVEVDPFVDTVAATASVGWPAAAGKLECTRVVLEPRTDDRGGLGIRPSGGQGSHMLGALADANALALVPPEVTRVEPGDLLQCLPLLGQRRCYG